MLLFIQKRLSAEWMAELFQYISCYSLSEYGNLKKLQKSCFNTSHVTLYRVKTQLRADHPRSFNTSHVTLYLNVKQFIEKRKRVSIHLMLLFILLLQPVQNCQARFQYISCYSLSLVIEFQETVTEEFQYISCYSLSGSTWQTETLQKFQYISCYSLSVSESDTFRTLWTFQYISCYSLSQSLQFLRLDPVVSIHLMLLFITLRRAKWSKNCSFNTSHVTLYQCRILENSESKPFQYISCYSLSTHRILISPRSMRVSIHLMLLFIGLFNKMAHRK